MGAEMKPAEVMNTSEQTTKYLGAMLQGNEQRLVLVPLDPTEPWAAFKRLRTWMKDSRTEQAPSVDVFEAPSSLTPTAKIIPLHRKTS